MRDVFTFHCLRSMLLGLFGSEIYNLVIIPTRVVCFLAIEVSVFKISSLDQYFVLSVIVRRYSVKLDPTRPNIEVRSDLEQLKNNGAGCGCNII